MANIDTLISNAETRVQNANLALNSSVNTLWRIVEDIKGLIIRSGDFPSLSINEEALPEFVKPDIDNTSDPSYEEPTTKLPEAPETKDVSTNGLIDAKNTLPSESPGISTEGLFNHQLPSTTIPNFDVEYPALNIDALVNELNAIARPILKEFDFPEISELLIGDVPELNLPEYVKSETPEKLESPQDYKAIFEERYNSALPEMQAFIDEKTDLWVSSYAPEYAEQRDALHVKIIEALNGQVLPEEYESALYNRAISRTDKEFQQAEVGISETHKKRGFFAPPGAVTSAINKLKISAVEINSNQATDIYVKRKEQEVQHLQFVLGIASQQVQSVRSLAIQSTGIYLNVIQSSISLADTVSNKVALVFEHEARRSELMIAVMDALNREFEARLKAALSELEGYKLQLEAAKQKTDIDVAQVGVIEAKYNAQRINVDLYSALVDSVTKKGAIEELRFNEYKTKGDIYNTEIQAQLATFEVYKAALSGDRSKLDAELSKLQVYESDIRAGQSRIDAEKAVVDATNAINDNNLKTYQTGADVYRTEVDAAIKKFTAESDVRKLAQQIYLGNLSADIDVHKITAEDKARLLDMQLKEFVTNSSTMLKQMELNLKAYSMIEDSSRATMTAYGNIAAASANSLNTMVSDAQNKNL